MNGTRHTYSALPAPRAKLAWGSITLGLTLWLGSGLALATSGRAYPGVTNGDPQEVWAQAGALGLLLLFFCPFFLARHEAGPEGVVVSLGLIFRGRIAYDDIASVQLTEHKPLTGLGLRLYPHALYALTWPEGLVSLRLKRPQRFWMLGFVPLWKVDEIVFSTAHAAQFGEAVRSKLGSGQDCAVKIV